VLFSASPPFRQRHRRDSRNQFKTRDKKTSIFIHTVTKKKRKKMFISRFDSQLLCRERLAAD